MYDTLYRLIAAGEYTLTDMVQKINVFWAESQITETERTVLLELAVSSLDIEQERPDLEDTVAALAERISALEDAVAVLQGDTGSAASYEEWTAWDGVSDKYQYGAIVSHNGKLYISIYKDGQNVWEPGVLGTESLWEEYTETTESED